jgi:hypothetical protein
MDMLTKAEFYTRPCYKQLFLITYRSIIEPIEYSVLLRSHRKHPPLQLSGNK